MPVRGGRDKVTVKYGYSYNHEDYTATEYAVPSNGLLELTFYPPADNVTHALGIEVRRGSGGRRDGCGVGEVCLGWCIRCQSRSSLSSPGVVIKESQGFIPRDMTLVAGSVARYC